MKDFKNIIMIYHIPVDNLSRAASEELLSDAIQLTKDDNFYNVLILPYTGGDIKKIIIETIDLKNTINNKQEKINLETLLDNQMKYFEPLKWNRLHKLKKLIKKL